MARICFVTLVFAPDGVSTSILMSELARGLQDLGHEVIVLTTTPHYNVEPEARENQPLTKRWGGLLYESNYHGIPVYHARIPAKGSRVSGRLLDYIRFHIISTLAGLFLVKDIDVLFVPSPPLTIGLSAWILRLFKGTPFIYNVQEIYPDVAIKLGILTNPALIRFFEGMESFIYKRSKVISVISERFRQRLLEKGVPDQKIEIVPNFVDTDFITPQIRHNPFSAKHNLDDKFVVLYAGNIGLTQGFESITLAAEALRENTLIHFLIVGDGTRRAWLEEELANKNYPNVTLLPYQKRSVVPQIYGTADVCLVPLKKGTAKDTFPSKIYTIMAAQRAVIASTDNQSELADLVMEAQCGWVVPPDDEIKLRDTIEEAASQPKIAKKNGENGHNYVHANYSRPVITQQYHQLIQRSITND